MKYARSILLSIAWIICMIWFYASGSNIVGLSKLSELNLSKNSVLAINGILIINLIASLFSLVGLSLSTFNKSLLQKRVKFRKLLIIGVCMFPIANIINLVGRDFELTRYFWTSILVSIIVSLIISWAISTAWRVK